MSFTNALYVHIGRNIELYCQYPIQQHDVTAFHNKATELYRDTWATRKELSQQLMSALSQEECGSNHRYRLVGDDNDAIMTIIMAGLLIEERSLEIIIHSGDKEVRQYYAQRVSDLIRDSPYAELKSMVYRNEGVKMHHRDGMCAFFVRSNKTWKKATDDVDVRTIEHGVALTPMVHRLIIPATWRMCDIQAWNAIASSGKRTAWDLSELSEFAASHPFQSPYNDAYTNRYEPIMPLDTNDYKETPLEFESDVAELESEFIVA